MAAAMDSNDDDSAAAQAEAGLYLDLIARTGSTLTEPILRKAMESPNTWIAMWGAIGLERIGRGAPDPVILRVAADASCRRAMHLSLGELRRLDRFPGEFADQRHLAEAEMVTWLMYPTELGSAPAEIELARVVELPNAGDPSDLYVFRFRTRPPHWASDKGWMIGVAGPFRRAEQPTLNSQGATFSRMESESEKALDEHIQAIVGTVADWRGPPDLR